MIGRLSHFLEMLWHDVRYGARALIKNPGFTALAALTLALGIGANTAIFSVVYGVLLRPLPYENGDQLVVLQQQAPLAGVNNMPFSVKEIADYREQNQTLQGLVEYHSMRFTLLGREEPQRVQTGVVSANFFELIGVKPLMGRSFLPADEEHGAEAVLILSYPYWQQGHGGDPNIVGKVFQMNDRPHRVVGVLPPIPQYPNENDVYMPVSACPFRSSDRFIENRNSRMMSVFGRLKPGVTTEQAQADIGTIAARLKQGYPESYPDRRGYGARVAALQEELTSRARPTLIILLVTAGLVLLIACANVANLMLARMIRREKEMAIRLALGAGRGRILCQLLTESTMLALAGGALGIVIATLGLDVLAAFAARFTTRANEIEIDGSVLLFTLLISVATGLIFGLMPALASGNDLSASIKEGGGRSTAGSGKQRLRSLLLVAQVAVSFVLLIGAGLMVRSLIKLQEVDPGFDSDNVLTMRINLNWSKYTTPQQTRDFYKRLLERVKSQPGVMSAAAASTFPLNPAGITAGPQTLSFQIEGRLLAEGEPAPQADFRTASPDYFQTVGVPLVGGRLFTNMDHEEAPGVAIINQAMARHRWGDEDPVDKRVSLDNGQTWLTIVGVVGDVKQYGLDSEAADELYRPMAQGGFAGRLLVRAAVDPMQMVRQVRETVYGIDPETAIDSVQTLERVRNESLASPRLTAVLLGLFAALALVITLTGIAGVMALWVGQRTQEIGVRMALGASHWAVLRMVLGQGVVLVVIGLALGIAGSFALTHLMSGLLFNIEPTDLFTYFAVSSLLLAAAVAACFAPARRATAIDPMTALRSE
ncbi:MAG: ABC transporter permease [Blastocatellia bacterium]|nr:ABC transporter permease [Blastocatellia bacterium]